MNKVVEIDSRFDEATLLEVCRITPTHTGADGSYGWSHVEYYFSSSLVRTMFCPKNCTLYPDTWHKFDKVAVGDYNGVNGVFYLGKCDSDVKAPYEK